MSDIPRRVYRAIVGLHPAQFRERLGQKMMLDFQDALGSEGWCRQNSNSR